MVGIVNFCKNFVRNGRGAQGTIEYLVLLAVVVIVALVAVFLIFGLGSGGSLSGNSDKVGKSLGDFGVVDDFYLSDGNYFLSLKSNLVGEFEVRQVVVGDVFSNFYSNNVVSLSGDRTFVVSSNDVCVEGERVSRDVSLTVADSRGFTKVVKGKYSFVCSSGVSISGNKVAGTVDTVTCRDLNVAGEIDSTDCDEVTDDCYNTVYCMSYRSDSSSLTAGVCGSANGVAVSVAPSTNLCSVGTASVVLGSGPFDWNCVGTNDLNVACSANLLQASDVTAPTLTITSSVVNDNNIRVYFTATDNNAILRFDRNYTGEASFTQFTPVTVTTNNYYLDLNNLSYQTTYTFCIKATDYNSNYIIDCDTNTTETEPVNPIVTSLRTGLIGYWPLDEDTNTFDLSGNANHGINHGATLTADGNVNGAYSFNRSNSNYITVSYSAVFPTGSSSRAVSQWIKPVSVSGTYLTSFGQGGSSSLTRFNYMVDPNNKIYFTTNNGDCESATGVFISGEWAHIVVTYNGSSIKLWVNGVLINSCSLALNTYNSSIDFGRYIPDNTYYYNGSIDEVAVWNRDLNSDEISWLYNSGNGLSLRTD